MTDDNIEKLVRSNIQTLTPYQSARHIGGVGDVWLNANESPFLDTFILEKTVFNRYPECQPKKLISAYANYVNLDINKILVTRGADEGIELLIKAFCEPCKDVIAYCPPTYDMYEIAAHIAGINTIKIPTKKNIWQMDIENIECNLNKVKIIYICNPNNPTGTIILHDDIIYLLKITQGKSLIVVDEAYIEFSPTHSIVNFLQDYPNLVILRTLSKAFSLAGIRCGFVLASQTIIKILQKVISPYPIAITVSEIACQALEKKYINIMYNRILEINKNRIWLISELKKLSCVEKIFHSSANYILVKFSRYKKIFQTLWNHGVILRNQNQKLHLKKCIRISIGTYNECVRVIEELKKLSHNQYY